MQKFFVGSFMKYLRTQTLLGTTILRKWLPSLSLPQGLRWLVDTSCWGGSPESQWGAALGRGTPGRGGLAVPPGGAIGTPGTDSSGHGVFKAQG